MTAVTNVSQTNSVPVSNTNDGSSGSPFLEIGINAATLSDPPSNHLLGSLGDDQIYDWVLRAGYCAVQGGSDVLALERGLRVIGQDRVNDPDEACRVAERHLAKGHESVTLHVGNGMESESEIYAFAEAIVDASTQVGVPLYIETHRATITQDIWRTVRLAEEVPGVRFTGDFSHWYTGLEMVYGDVADKIRFLEPVFDRVRYIHGRIGDPGCMQVAVTDLNATNVRHFEEMWARSFAGFLSSAAPGDYIGFAPELLGPRNFYARLTQAEDGKMNESSDRWDQALILVQIARAAFSRAQAMRAPQPTPHSGPSPV